MVTKSDQHGHLTEIVNLADGRRYPVLVGRGALSRLGELVPSEAKRVAIVTQDNIVSQHNIGAELDLGVESKVLTVPDGESAKSLAQVERLCGDLAEWGFTRSDLIVGLGGGVVTDLAGFTAASYHRGVRVVHASTTLLGQIDAAIGGKTGVNISQGKNLVGAFWQPTGVICDTETLQSLPEIEFRAGMGELAKYHFLGGANLDSLDLEHKVAACVRIKADVVAVDEREGGRRVVLNYGHTLAHALEAAAGFKLRHGAAVAVGLLYAAELARLLGRVDESVVTEHRRVLDKYELVSTVPDGLEPSSLIDLFSRDKKALTGVTFVLDGPDGIEPVIIDDRAVLLEAFEAVT